MSKPPEPTISFPPEFYFGLSSSAYQTEGAVGEGGRGRSVWDAFCEQEGTVERGESGAVACDHYHCWPEDIQLLKDLGVDRYRFSFAWPRILPEGTGKVDPEGIDFYSRLIDGLLEANIEPVVCLYHWDLPETLWKDHQGWMGRKTVDAMVEYAGHCFEAFADRVTDWVVLNEPCNIHGKGSYGGIVHAPAAGLGLRGQLTAGHHQLLAFSRIHELYHRENRAGRVGLGEAYQPPRQSVNPISKDLLRRYRDIHFGWYLDVLAGGKYPCLDEVPALVEALPETFEEDCEFIASRGTDFFAVNYYTSAWLQPSESDLLGFESGSPPEEEVTWRNSLHWPVRPEGIIEVLDEVSARLPGVPLVILENGFCDEQVPDGPGEPVGDTERIEFFTQHLSYVSDWIRRGNSLEGYYAWTLMDNFEWAKGYRPRFGLVSVDFSTQKRTLKASAHWYRQLMQNHRAKR